MAALLEVDHLYKRYGAVVVADDICCAVDHASCVGLIGPNGAGKSSLFNMLTGIIAPDDGVIRFEGRDIGGIAAHGVRGSASCAPMRRDAADIAPLEPDDAVVGRDDAGQHVEQRALAGAVAGH